MMNQKNSYDEIPYVNYPYPQTHPANLYSIGKLFSFDGVDIKKCRVLELGCASGYNIIPLADEFPLSEFVGIDLSSVQIEEGQKIVSSLGLKNIKLETKSILDFSPKDGKFDYIICHGILSWVPEDVQKKIFEIFDENLSENGMAYVSYNTLPGWNMVKSVRDMMLFHADKFEKVEEKASQVISLLNFVESVQPENSILKELIKEEKRTLEGRPVSYMMHDHLSEENQGFYLYEIAKKADNHNLQYLGDVSIPSMHLDNYAEKVKELLASSDDIINTEQYLDFISNRRFRSSILVHKNQTVNRNITLQKIKDYYMSPLMIIADESKNKLPSDDTEITYFNSTGSSFSSKNKYLNAAFLTLFSNPLKPIHFNDLVKKANEKYNLNNEDAVAEVLIEAAIPLFCNGFLSVCSYTTRTVLEISEKPKALPIARYLAVHNQGSLINANHLIIKVDKPLSVVISYLDGNHSISDLEQKFLEHIKSGDLIVTKEDKTPVEDHETLKSYIKDHIIQSLNVIRDLAILIE